jgi:hypothetical protein
MGRTVFGDNDLYSNYLSADEASAPLLNKEREL